MFDKLETASPIAGAASAIAPATRSTASATTGADSTKVCVVFNVSVTSELSVTLRGVF